MKQEKKMSNDIAFDFEKVLESKKEEHIHQFLNKNQNIVSFFSSNDFVCSKYRLADAFIPDFLIIGREHFSNDIRAHVILMEIERSNIPIFTKTGDPTSQLTHAIRQVQDWKTWMKVNRTYLQTNLHKLLVENEIKDLASKEKQPIELKDAITHGFSEHYIVVAGRRNSMNVKDRLRLSQMNDDLDNIKIITYDVLLDRLLYNLGSNEGIHPYW